MIICTVLYKNDADFDHEYYQNNHRPRFEQTALPLGAKKIEAHRVLGTADGSAPGCQVIANVYFDNLAVFQAAMQDPAMGEMLADIPNFYRGKPEILLTED
jgi:uncharacterized protein (TIGR02118 family)